MDGEHARECRARTEENQAGKTVTQRSPIPKGIDTRGPRPQERVVTGTLTPALKVGAGSRSTGPIHAPRARVLAYIVNKIK